MVGELQYESPIALQQFPKLEVGDGGPILTVRPVTPRWWYLFYVVFWILQCCALCALGLILIWILRAFPSRAGWPARDIKQVLILELVLVALWLLEIPFVTMSFRQLRKGLTPRKVWISNGSIHFNRAGNSAVSTTTRDLQSVREIRLKPTKGFFGGTAGGLLIVRFGRFRRWAFRFKQDQMPLAIEAQSRFARCLEQSSKATPGGPPAEQSLLWRIFRFDGQPATVVRLHILPQVSGNELCEMSDVRRGDDDI